MQSKLLISTLLVCFVLLSCEKNKSQYAICAVCEKAYRSDSLTWEVYSDDSTTKEISFQEFGVEQQIFNYIKKKLWQGELYDWNLSIMNSVNIEKNRTGFLDLYDLFLVFKQEPTTSHTKCIMTVEIHNGKPYSKNSVAVASFTAEASIGEFDVLSNTTIYDKSRACKVALNRATEMALTSGLLTPE